MFYYKKDHTFVICAHKESKYLKKCIESLKRQTVKTNIIMVTSTNNKFIRDSASVHDIPLYINQGEGGITQDWNFGYGVADTALVTIAHQDDIYAKDYAENMLKMVNKSEHPLIFFTDYGEIRAGKKVLKNRLLSVKRFMLKPLEWSTFYGNRFVRRRILSLGSPICCPSVTFIKPNLMDPVFENHFLCDEDWEAWEKISRLKGDFLYCKKILTFHRIHGESVTTSVLENTGRSNEDYAMYRKFWPPIIARLLVRFYTSSEKSNKMENL